MENLLEYFDVLGLLLKVVFALDWEMIPPKNFLLLLKFVKFCLLKVGLSAVLVPAECPVPVFLHPVAECVCFEPFHFLRSVEGAQVFYGLRKAAAHE